MKTVKKSVNKKTIIALVIVGALLVISLVLAFVIGGTPRSGSVSEAAP